MTRPIIQTPRGSVVIGKRGKAELKFEPNFRPKWQARYDRAQMFVDSEVLRLCEPYVPLLTSMLVKSGILGTDIGSGEVAWIAPYAKYQYYGKVMAGNPKKATDKDLKYHGGGLRGSFWFERMKAVHRNRIVAGARRIAGGSR